MREVEDWSDERLKAWCIQCGRPAHEAKLSRDHVPSKSLLSKAVVEAGSKYDGGTGEPDDYLPQVLICEPCNLGFARDESYLKCVLHAVMAGSLRPNPAHHAEAANFLRSNRHFVRELQASIKAGDEENSIRHRFTLFPDMTRVERVVVKNARGHAYHETGEPLLHEPTQVWIRPFSRLSKVERDQFETQGSAGVDVWPEVGSRMMVRVTTGEGLANGGWIEVEPARYRYALDWTSGVSVKMVLWDYLAAEVRWEAD